MEIRGPADSKWGRYNVNYLDVDGTERPATSDVISENKRSRTRPRRHTSDSVNGAESVALKRTHSTTGGNKSQRQRVGRRQSEGYSDTLTVPTKTDNLEPCLRLSIIRREMSERKKRVAFAEGPAVVWNDPRPPAICIPLPPPSHSRTAREESASTSTSDSNGKDAAGAEEGPEILTPKERRRRKVVMAVVCTTFILLTASALFVLITLFNASAIDEAGILPFRPVYFVCRSTRLPGHWRGDYVPDGFEVSLTWLPAGCTRR